MKEIYFDEVKKILTHKLMRNKLHGYSQRCLIAFPLSIAIWEAILNEQFTSDIISDVYKTNLLFDITNQAEKWDIKTKTFMYPKFLFGNTFDSSLSVFSDFNDILEIRNNIVHYKHSLYEGPDKAIKNLTQKKITYPKPDNVGCPWQMEIFSTECFRFCINTISTLVQLLSKLETSFYKEMCIPIRKEFFSKITDEDVIKVFNEYKIDANSICNDFYDVTSSQSKI